MGQQCLHYRRRQQRSPSPLPSQIQWHCTAATSSSAGTTSRRLPMRRHRPQRARRRGFGLRTIVRVRCALLATDHDGKRGHVSDGVGFARSLVTQKQQYHPPQSVSSSSSTPSLPSTAANDRVVVVIESELEGHHDSFLSPVDEHTTAPETPLCLSRARSLRLSSHPPQITCSLYLSRQPRTSLIRSLSVCDGDVHAQLQPQFACHSAGRLRRQTRAAAAARRPVLR